MYKRIIYQLIQSIWLQPVVRTIMLNDVYRLNSLPNIEYGVVCIEAQDFNIQETYGDMLMGNFRLIYVDRLDYSKSNMIDVQSTGIDVLHNIIRQVDEDIVEVQDQTYRPFTQKFKDECAGAYLNVKLGIAENYSCGPQIAGDFNYDFNEDFLITRPELHLAGLVNGPVINTGDFNEDYNDDFSKTNVAVQNDSYSSITVNTDQVQTRED